MSSFSWSPVGGGSGSGGLTIYNDLASFPSANTVPLGTVAVARDTGLIYENVSNVWVQVAGPGFIDNAIPNTEKGAADGVATLGPDGFVPIEQMQPAVLERIYLVPDEVARFSLTTDEVQNGDTVRQDDTMVMYMVIDDTNLDNVLGYAIYSAGTAVNFTGSLAGDVTGIQSVTTVASVGGSSAANVHAAELLANAATNANTANAIVKRDASGNFSAGTITANLTGTASGNVALTGNETVAGNKTFTGNIISSGAFILTPTVNSSLSGANARIPSHASSNIVFTNAGLTSIGSANNGVVVGGHTLQITNATGATITIVNNYGGAAAGEAILTGNSADAVILNNTTFWLQYNATGSVWSFIGSGLTAVGSGAVTGTLPVANGGTNSSTALTNDKVMVSTSGAVVESATTTTQLGYLDATSSIQTQLNGKALTDLSNLTPTAVNQDLTFDTSASPANRAIKTSLTSGASPSGDLAIGSGISAGTASSGNVDVTSGVASGGSAYSGNVTLTSGNSVNYRSGAATLSTGNGSQNTGNAIVRTGNASAGNSGDIVIQTGSATTFRGEIILDGRQVNVSSKKIVNVTDPTSAQDAATKNYADTKIANSIVTTKGDLITATGSSTPVRQAIGSDGQILVADSTATNGLKWATANSGSKNYFQYNSFENNATTGWSLGTATLTTNFPSGAPTFGSGASGNLSLSTVSGSPIAGTYALSYASSAATTAGDFVASDAFTIDAEDQAKVLQFKFSYKAQTNPSNANWSGTTSNSFGVAIYDVTNSAWIQPAGCFNLVQSSGVGIASGTFQTSSSGTSYRLCVYNANATSGAVTVYFDSFFVGPQITAAGAAVSDWTSYTPTGTFSTNTTYNTSYWRRVGESMEVTAKLSLAGAPNAVTLAFNIPTGYTINTARLTGTSTYDSVVGEWGAVRSGVTVQSGIVGVASSTTIQLLVNNVNAYVNATNPNTWGAGDVISVKYSVPIVGWSSNTVMSSDTDTRVVSFAGTNSGTQSVTANTTNIAVTASKDSHGAWSGTVYTVPVAGDYSVGIVSADTVAVISFRIYKNGSASLYVGGGQINNATSNSILVPGLVAGDTISIRSNTTGTLIANTSISIFRLSGPATIAASAVVSARLYKATNQSYADSADDKFLIDTVDIDTVGGFNAANNRYIIQSPGKYRIVGKMLWAASNTTGFRGARIKINGTLIDVDQRGGPSGGYASSAIATVVRSLNAGDYVELYGQHTAGTSVTATGGATIGSALEIERIGGI